MKRTGASIFVEALQKENVDVIFGFPGGAVLPIFDELYEAKVRWQIQPASRANAMPPIAPSRIEPAPVGEEGEGPSLSDLRNKARPPLEPASRSPLALSREQSIQRGTLTHALLEHLPDLPPDQRAPAARRFLDARGRGLDEAVRGDINAKVLAILDDPQFAEAFGPASRAEVSIAAVVPSPDGKGPPLKVNGQIDRLVPVGQAGISDNKIHLQLL